MFLVVYDRLFKAVDLRTINKEFKELISTIFTVLQQLTSTHHQLIIYNNNVHSVLSHRLRNTMLVIALWL